MKHLSWKPLLAIVFGLLLAGPSMFWAQEKKDAGAEPAKEESPYKKELREREKEYEALVAEIRQKAPKYASLQYPEPKSAEEVQSILLKDDKTALLEYMVGDKIAVLFLLERPVMKDGKVEDSGLTVYMLDREKVIETARKFHTSISNPTSRDYKDLGKALYKLIISPAEARLAGKENLFIIPDGALFYVPFEALLDAKGQFLINRFSITYGPSASVLAELYEEKAQPKTRDSGGRVAYLGIGDPVFSAEEAQSPEAQAVAFRGSSASTAADKPSKKSGGKKKGEAEAPKAEPAPASASEAKPEGGEAAGEEETSIDDLLKDMEFSTRGLYEGRGYQFQRIPYTGLEVRESAQLFQNKKTEVLLREQARKSALMERDLTRYNVIHFATHGVVDEEVPTRSGVVLSLVGPDGQPEEGFLPMSEIFNMRLDADLVTLSACQTGLGKEIRGEGMVGLTRAFLYAGSPSVIVSLWNVNDLTTAYLMTNFYRYMQEGLSKSEALRRARRDMATKKVDLGSLNERLGEMQRSEARERGFGEVTYEAKPVKSMGMVNASHPYYWAAFVLVGHPQ